MQVLYYHGNSVKIVEACHGYMLFINGKIITMENDCFENGYIKTEGGLITAVGDMSEIEMTGEQIIDFRGKTVYPGFIDAHSHIGMWEDGLGEEGADGNEETDPLTPNMNAIDAVNHADRCFKEAADAGITTVLTGPGSANPVSGIWIAMKTCGRRIDDMVIDKAVGMKFALGENPKNVYNGKGQSPMTRMATAALIREQLRKAKRYLEDLRLSEQDEDYDKPDYDDKCEAMIPLLKGEMKAFFHAHREDDIFTAIRIAKEFSLDYVLVHATEGYRIADILSRENVSVIAGPVICDRSKPELRNLDPKNAGVLAKNGILTAVCTDHPVIPVQYLPLSAGVCVGAGMDYLDAVAAITINAAVICGIDDKVGSIAPGKSADFAVFEDDLFSPYSSPNMVVIDGKVVKDENC